MPKSTPVKVNISETPEQPDVMTPGVSPEEPASESAKGPVPEPHMYERIFSIAHRKGVADGYDDAYADGIISGVIFATLFFTLALCLAKVLMAYESE